MIFEFFFSFEHVTSIMEETAIQPKNLLKFVEVLILWL